MAGITCPNPKCDSDDRPGVVWHIKRLTNDKQIARCRICQHCGTKFTTVESMSLGDAYRAKKPTPAQDKLPDLGVLEYWRRKGLTFDELAEKYGVHSETVRAAYHKRRQEHDYQSILDLERGQNGR